MRPGQTEGCNGGTASRRPPCACAPVSVTWRVTLTLGGVGAFLTWPCALSGQEPEAQMPSERQIAAEPPTLRAGLLPRDLRLDGVLDEPEWEAAPAIDALTMTEPVEGGPLIGATLVRVLAGPTALVIGVEAFDPQPERIVSYSIQRDPSLTGEDHIKFVLDPFLDGRSGYVFAINPRGARYDALVAKRGEGEDKRWDAVWEAKTSRNEEGWFAEIRIPIQSLTFQGGLEEWGFNIERRLDRLQEVSRWASPIRDARVSQTSRAGRITDLPAFDTGLGLTVRPTVAGGFEKPEPGADTEGHIEPSLDVAQRIGPNVTVIATLNTDFAETEVDTRRINLTRFSLFFPEKRTFFLEGADIYNFGLGLASDQTPDLVPFFTRRIGLYAGEQVPLLVGGKLNGRIGNTNFGGLITRTGDLDTLVNASTMGAARIQQNVLEESSVGVIATFGDPEGSPGAYTLGADFIFQTSRLFGDKNFLVGAWGLVTDREGLEGDRSAFGGKIDYPNDTWDISLTYTKIGDGFDPSLGFVPRRGIHKAEAGAVLSVRPGWPWLRLMEHVVAGALVLDSHGKWESRGVFTSPINWTFESGERLELGTVWEEERLVEPFEIAEGVVIPPGSYDWLRYGMAGEIASKRKVSGRASWWFGSVYDGSLNQIDARLNVNPLPIATIELSFKRNVARLEAGDFTQELWGGRLRLNFSPDLELSSFIQYDDESRLLGANTRLRWTFRPLGDVFVVYNHSVVDRLDRWELDSNQLIIKAQYAFRY